ncbi:roadblock/LC7 domain-containing protein [Methanobacterium sp. ACI-7]|uniref:roadblock/LC7 domain-containing protein n=1 Tax=unclassified Methanobacterium TaxID=2627676 RepID=UPI0039C31CCA
MDPNVENQLIRILNDLNRIDGVESSLITDSSGNVVCHSMSKGTDTTLFGPMAHVITSSSKRLLNSTNQGEIERVLVESGRGKALFLQLGNVNFILLMDIRANVGLVIVSAKRASSEIIEITKDFPAETFAEDIPQEVAVTEEILEVEEKSEIDKLIESDVEPEQIEEVIEKITATEDITEVFDKVVGPEKLDEIMESSEFKSLDEGEVEEKLVDILEIGSKEDINTEEEPPYINEEVELEPETVEEVEAPEIVKEEIEVSKIADDDMETPVLVEKEIEEPKSRIPVIKPPISFPKLPEDVQIPESGEGRVNLILDIYESIFLAMSIGASKIMGVAPARGLIKKFLPLDECKTLLKDVEVKSNSAIDFDKIRENSKDIHLAERESILIADFSRIIEIITENYGRVMGYGAFRGIVRAEFKVINNSYGKPMDELGIKDKIHPELNDLFK